MDVGSHRRSTGVAGIIFVVLFVVGTLFASDGPSFKSSESPQGADQKFLHYLSSSGNRAEHLIGGYLLILAAIVFIWFCGGLRSRVEAAGTTGTIPGRFVFGLAVLGATAMTGAALSSAVVAGSVSLGGDPLPSTGEAARVVMNLTFPFLFLVFGLVSAALIATISIATMRSGIFPRWIAYTGWLAVLGSIGGIILTPMVLPLLWYLAVAIVGMRGGAAARPAVPAV